MAREFPQRTGLLQTATSVYFILLYYLREWSRQGVQRVPSELRRRHSTSRWKQATSRCRSIESQSTRRDSAVTTLSSDVLSTAQNKIGPVVSAQNRLTDGNALWFGDFIKYLRIYWTNFRNVLTISKRFMCRWWICTLFSNLFWDVTMATKWCCHNEGKLILCAFFAHSPDGRWKHGFVSLLLARGRHCGAEWAIS